MNRIKFAIVVAVITAAVILAGQGAWLHFHPSATLRTAEKSHKPLGPQAAGDAQQAARDFFTAMKDGDWETAKKFWPNGRGVNKKFDDVFTDQTKGILAGLEIVSIGTPYQQGQWTMVPYEVQFKGGGSQTNSLRLQKGPGDQWVWGGGF